MTKALLFLFILLNLNISAQNKRDYQWFFGSGDKDPEITGIQTYQVN